MRRTAVALLLASVAGLGGARRAAAQEVPRGEIGMAVEFRKNLGALTERYGLGYLWGFVAGMQITRPEERFGLGVRCTTLFGRSQLWEAFGADAPAVADGPLKYFELALELRLRYAPSEDWPLYVVGSGGHALMRTHVPIPPADARLYNGGLVGLGLEYYLGKLLIGLDGRYGLFGDAPRSVAWMLSVGLGR